MSILMQLNFFVILFENSVQKNTMNLDSGLRHLYRDMVTFSKKKQKEKNIQKKLETNV